MKNFLRRLVKWLLFGIPTNKTYANISLLQCEDRLKDKKVLITGGGGGLGFNMAKKLVQSGAKVAICGRNEEKLKNASSQLDNCPYFKFDVCSFTSYKEVLEKANLALGGGLNCLINNAGISLHEPSFEDVTLETFDQQFNTNLKAPYFLSQEFVKYVINQNIQNANILFVTSERGLYCDILPYGLTKVAISSLTAGLSRRYVTKGIRINAVAPGVTASDLVKIDPLGNIYRENSCGKRFFLGEEVAEVVSFLLSNESMCINGEIIPCNQGNHYRSDY